MSILEVDILSRAYLVVLFELSRYHNHMSDLVTENRGGESYSYYPMGKYVVRALGVCGGRPTFKHTRIEITGALARLAGGETLEAVVAGYAERVTREAVLEASEIMAREFLSHLPKLQAA
jgi:uncharacterized protein (DUF433 family)